MSERSEVEDVQDGDASPPPKPPTPASKKWVRYVVGFSVGVGVGLAPFLGKLDVPGFTALLHYLPRRLHDEVIPLSAFLMGLVALGTQFYVEPIERPKRFKRMFTWCLGLTIALLVAFIVIKTWTVVTIHIDNGAGAIGVIVGFGERIATCPCDGGSSVECLADLTLAPGAVEKCWSARSIQLAVVALSVLYLALLALFGALVGMLIRNLDHDHDR